MSSQFDGELLDAMRRGSDSAWVDAYDMLAGDLRSYIARLGALSPDNVLGETLCISFATSRNFEERLLNSVHGHSQWPTPLNLGITG
ncbi:MAG: hypothetical protein FJW98_06460 [Actinobacteria bacterium]|nr:hypothetical protein [Actinomycetota bacterium]